MEYNKKQIQPLIDKFAINPETNTFFQSIIKMFEGQPNYQLWAVKVLFGGQTNIEELTAIHAWLANNKNHVKRLSKANIVSYTREKDFILLRKEMNGIDMVNTISKTIACFNTDQRKILAEKIMAGIETPLDAYNSSLIHEVSQTFANFNKISPNRRKKMLSNCSALRDYNLLYKAIKDSIKETYIWEKEDMLAFMEANTPTCTVVFNQGPYVILRVPGFTESKKLCGGGRTEWCITMQDGHWNTYSSSRDGKTQYFFFDFSKKESASLAHVGFTTKKGKGIITAQTCENKNMLSEFKVNGENWNIFSLLKHIGCDPAIFSSITPPSYEWEAKGLLSLLNAHKDLYESLYDKDGYVLVLVKRQDEKVVKLIEHTNANWEACITRSLNDGGSKLFILFNFNVDYKKDESICMYSYEKDKYGTYSLRVALDAFNNNIKNEHYLERIGFDIDNLVGLNKIDKRVLLHKYIEEQNEKKAVELVENSDKNFDVNYEFSGSIPIYSALSNHMKALFKAIIEHPMFEADMENSYGETLLQSLLFIYASDEVAESSAEGKEFKELIDLILSSDKFSINTIDINEDTAINIACHYPKLLWVVERLVKNPRVNLNQVNDFNCTALGEAIRCENIEALKLIGMRPDLKVREYDKQLAKEHKIKLEEYIAPNESVFGHEYAYATAVAQ